MYKWETPSRQGIDGRKAGKCISLVTGQPVTRSDLEAAKRRKAREAKKRKL